MYGYFLIVQFSYVHFRPGVPCRFHAFRKTIIYKVNTKQGVKATKHVACLCACNASEQRETFTDLRNLFKRNIILAKSVNYRTEIDLARDMFRFTSYLIGCCRCSVLPKCNDDPDSMTERFVVHYNDNLQPCVIIIIMLSVAMRQRLLPSLDYCSPFIFLLWKIH